MQLQKETAYLPPSCSLLWGTIVKLFTVAIWPVTGQGVKNTKLLAVPYSVNFTNRKTLANLNYHMSIKTSQSILKCFIDFKSSVWFILGSKDETVFCDT